ncbi:hypothetical protein [Nocardia sp. NPDC052566]|uniref:hypothetical protein n=1 Tax=Nocardia sp. NPDC052566 TaxID=3364330 RepID=UPI0037C5799E
MVDTFASPSRVMTNKVKELLGLVTDDDRVIGDVSFNTYRWELESCEVTGGPASVIVEYYSRDSDSQSYVRTDIALAAAIAADRIHAVLQSDLTSSSELVKVTVCGWWARFVTRAAA